MITATVGLLTVVVGPLRLTTASGLPVGHAVHVRLRPEEVGLALATPASDGSTSLRNHLPGTISRLVPQGALVRVEIDCGAPVIAAVTRPAVKELRRAPGVPVVASVKASAIH